jgi:hypothetical protein
MTGWVVIGGRPISAIGITRFGGHGGDGDYRA